MPLIQRHWNTKRWSLSTFTSCQPFSASCETPAKIAYRLTINKVSTFNGTCSNFPRDQIIPLWTIRLIHDNTHARSIRNIARLSLQRKICFASPNHENLLFTPDQRCHLQGISIWKSPHHTACLLSSNCRRLCRRRRRSNLPQTWTLSLRYKFTAMFLFLSNSFTYQNDPLRNQQVKNGPCNATFLHNLK